MFRNPGREDYRLSPQNQLNSLGLGNQFTASVGHDFYGLLRFPDDGRTVGAFRREPVPRLGTDTLVELELQDGQRRRLYDIMP
jgi:hypothetical protein